MAEYWKSTPRYWCKYCSTYVRDTKLERTNHDATAKHQSAIKRSLKDLHRGKEREEREKERAKREVDRLNGVVSSASSSTAGGSGGSGRGEERRGSALGESERKRQAEQLASLGVSIPEHFRGDLAMAGEWTVTSTTIVPEKSETEKQEAIARGVRKRERTEEELEEEEAMKGLFKKPRRWGRDSKMGGGGGSEDLDALLSGGLVVKKKEEDNDDGKEVVKKEEGDEAAVQDIKKEGSEVTVKKEEDEPSDATTRTSDQIPAAATTTTEDGSIKNADLPPLPIKQEEDAGDDAAATADEAAPAVVFKKRKPKNVRQK